MIAAIPSPLRPEGPDLRISFIVYAVDGQLLLHFLVESLSGSLQFCPCSQSLVAFTFIPHIQDFLVALYGGNSQCQLLLVDKLTVAILP